MGGERRRHLWFAIAVSSKYYFLNTVWWFEDLVKGWHLD